MFEESRQKSDIEGEEEGRDRTFSMFPPANPTITARPFHAMHLSDGTIMPTGS